MSDLIDGLLINVEKNIERANRALDALETSIKQLNEELELRLKLTAEALKIDNNLLIKKQENGI